MRVREYLKNHQPLVYRTFLNALKGGRLAHAYLLSGSPGMPLREIAVYLAMSVLCEHNEDLACGECPICQRVMLNDYPDLMVIDNGGERIKKGDVQSVILNFDKTALEKRGIMVYVIDRAENMTPVAVNSLLKFLEEPGRNVYAFLTTENVAKILPTIVSRSELLRLKPIPREDVISEALEEGVEKEDAELLSAVYNDAGLVRKAASTNNYRTVKACLDDQLEALPKGKDEALFACDRQVVPKIRTYELARLYLDLLASLFRDLVRLADEKSVVASRYANILGDLGAKLAHPEKSLLAVMSARGRLAANVNIALLLESIVLTITEEIP